AEAPSDRAPLVPAGEPLVHGEVHPAELDPESDGPADLSLGRRAVREGVPLRIALEIGEYAPHVLDRRRDRSLGVNAARMGSGIEGHARLGAWLRSRSIRRSSSMSTGLPRWRSKPDASACSWSG